MPSISVARNSNLSFTPSYAPIILITGATSGIGQTMSEIFARNPHGRAHIILVGRNRAAAERIIASFPTPPSSGNTGAKYTYEFIQCDITLMKNVHSMAKELLRRLTKINFLVHCAGVAGLRGRVDTVEGIDKKMAVRYYARFALSYDLLPLLRKAQKMGEPASVEFVFSSGVAPEIDLDDLGLRKTYTGFKAMFQTGSYADVILAVSSALLGATSLY